MAKEPVLSAAVILGLVQAAVVLAVSMGWLDLSTEQQNSIYAFAAALAALILPLLAGWYARTKTTPAARPVDAADDMPLVRADTQQPSAQALAAGRYIVKDAQPRGASGQPSVNWNK